MTTDYTPISCDFHGTAHRNEVVRPAIASRSQIDGIDAPAWRPHERDGLQEGSTREPEFGSAAAC